MITHSRRAAEALLGKEIRDSRGMVLGLVLLLAARHFLPPYSPVDRQIASFLDYAPALLAVLWGATNGDSRNRRRLFERTHLPVSVYQLWLVSFGCPAVVLFIASSWAEIVSKTTEAASLPGAISAPQLLLFFGLAYLVSGIWSQGLAAVAGAAAIVAIPAVTQALALDPAVVAWSGAAGAAVAVLLSIALKGVARDGLNRGLCVALFLLALVAPSTANICRTLLTPAPPFEPHIYTAANKAITIRALDPQGAPLSFGRTAAEYRDRRTGTVRRHTFTSGWHAAWVAQESIAYFLEADPANHGAKITRWDTLTDQYETVVTLPLQPDFDSLCQSGHFASVDPSGRFMVARLAAIRNSSVDLWLIDLVRGRANVVMQSASHFDPGGVRWLPGKALVPTYRSRIIQVDLATGRAVYLSQARKVL